MCSNSFPCPYGENCQYAHTTDEIRNISDNIKMWKSSMKEVNYFQNDSQRVRKFKKVRTKKLVKSNKAISRKKILTKIHFFATSKIAKNQFLNWEKV